MLVKQREKEAIVHFLGCLREERRTRRRLFARASDEPEKVLIYLNSLPEGVAAADELTRRLRAIATAALRDGIDLGRVV